MKLHITAEELDLIVYALNVLVAHGEAKSRRALPRKARELIEKLTSPNQQPVTGGLVDSGIALALQAMAKK
jgi:phage terminase large subunit GpA-like protein